MTLRELLSHLIIYKTDTTKNPDIQSVEVDSRSVRAGSLFVCLKGFTVDGHDFAGQAAQQGAAAIMTDHELGLSTCPTIIVPDTQKAAAVLADVFYKSPTKKMNLVGVTGTNGKTTVTYLLDHIFQASERKSGRIGTLGMSIDSVPMKATSDTPTTPEVVTLQKVFANMQSAQVNDVVMEVSSHALALGRVHGCDFNIAVFTNLTQDHLDFHPTMEAYFYAKSLLFSQLGNTYDDKQKAAVINRDDAYAERLYQATAVPVITYGIKDSADVMAESIHLDAKKTAFPLLRHLAAVKLQCG